MVSKVSIHSSFIIFLIFTFFSVSIPAFAQDDSIKVIDYGVNTSVEEPIKYTAKDSVISTLKPRIIKLYNEGIVEYQDFILKAGYIVINLDSNIVYATGLKDSTNSIVQEPQFTQAGKTYEVNKMKFNLKSKKGKINQLKTNEGEGYLYGYEIKRQVDNSFNFKKGRYTTCNHPEPHFYIEARKLKFTEDRKIFTGPAQMIIGGVKTPLVLPFAYFPLKDKKTFGVLLPAYNFSRTRGFSLNNLGFYMGISEYWDNTLKMDLFSGGTIAFKNHTRYKKRYGFNGDLKFNYASIKDITKSNELSERESQYSVIWTHRQDNRANPFGTFSANVDMTSSGYNQNTNTSLVKQIKNEYRSTASYQRDIFDRRFNISLNAAHNMTNIGDRPVTLTLPSLNLRTNGNIYPFKNLIKETSNSFAKKISFTPTFESKVMVNTYDSLMFTSKMFDNIKTGASYNIPFSLPINISPIFNIRPSLRYSGKFYPAKTTYHWNQATDTLNSTTLKGIYHTYDINASVNFGLNPRLYGFYNLKKGKIKTIRHMIIPSVNYTYNFDFLDRNRNFQYIAENNTFNAKYGADSYLSSSGTPSLEREQKLGSIRLSLNNTLDLKVKKNKTDTVGNEKQNPYKKVKVFDVFSFSTNYNLDADSFNLERIVWNTNFVPLKNMGVTLNSRLDPYTFKDGKREDKFFFQDSKNFFPRIESFSADISYRFSGKSKSGNSLDKKIDKMKKSDNLTALEELEIDDISQNSFRYLDFDIPYSLTLSLNTNLTRRIDNSLQRSSVFSVNGDLSLTNTMKVVIRSGYDLKNRTFSHSNFELVKDLHCWRFSFNWTPTGQYAQYTFQINVKASVLQDLKLSKRSDVYDNSFF